MSSTGTIERIDSALRTLYHNIGINNYDSNGIGKFMQYCQNNEFGDTDIYEELHGDPQDCVICDFDATFPLNHAFKNYNKQKNISIFKILKNCCDYGKALLRAEKQVKFTTNDYKKQFINLNTADNDIDKIKELYKDQIPDIMHREDNYNYLQLLNISNLNNNIPFTIYFYELFVRCILDKDNGIEYSDSIQSQFSIIWDKYPLLRSLFPAFADSKARNIVYKSVEIFTQSVFPFIPSYKNIHTLINDNIRDLVDKIGIICEIILRNVSNKEFNTPFQIDLWVMTHSIASNMDEKREEYSNGSVTNTEQRLKQSNIKYSVFESMDSLRQKCIDISKNERICIVLETHKIYVCKYSEIPKHFIPETLFEYTKHYMKNLDYTFGVSFHCYSVNEIRIYFIYKNGILPFRPCDIFNIWPKYFVLSEQNKAFINSKKEAILDKFVLKDMRFDAFYTFITNKSAYDTCINIAEEDSKSNGQTHENIHDRNHRIGNIKKALIGYDEWLNNEALSADHETVLQFLQHLLGDNYSMIDLLNDYHFILNICFDNNGDSDTNVFENIYENIAHSVPCDIHSCAIIVRNNRNKSVLSMQENNKLFLNIHNENDILLMQLLDTIHCTLYHTFDIGYKLRMAQINDIRLKMKDKIDDFEYENLYLSELKQALSKVRKQSRNVSHKFSTELIMSDSKEDDFEQPISLSIGQRFVYWNESSGNEKEYVSPKYANLKCELLNAPNHKLTNEEWVIEHKRCDQIYIESELFRKLKCDFEFGLVCGIHCGDSLNCDHLTALKCFCDYTELKQIFVKSFKKLHNSDTFAAIKQRHSYFANWARLLNEVIVCFGDLSNNQIAFYHRISNKNMVYLQCNTAMFNCLTAVTTSAQVLLANNNGLVLELGYHCGSVPYFHCCYISAFTNEMECILGSNMPWLCSASLSINNITNICKSYRHYIRALHIFYGLINGKSLRELYKYESIHKFDVLCIDQFIFCVRKVPKYIQILFKQMCKSMKAIVINKGLLDTEYARIKKYFITQKTEDFIRIEIFNKLFANMEHIIIRPFLNAVSKDKDFSINLTKSTMFSMMSAFQALPKQSKLKLVTIMKPKQNRKMKLKEVATKQSAMFQFMGWNLRYIEPTNSNNSSQIAYETLEIRKIM